MNFGRNSVLICRILTRKIPSVTSYFIFLWCFSTSPVILFQLRADFRQILQKIRPEFYFKSIWIMLFDAEWTLIRIITILRILLKRYRHKFARTCIRCQMQWLHFTRFDHKIFKFSTLGAVHKRRRNFFGRFWYPPPPCRNFDPDLPNFYLLISCTIGIGDPPPP